MSEPKNPAGNEALQFSWSRGESMGVKHGAINRVDEVLEARKKLSRKFPMGPDTKVLVIGSQNGFEPYRYKEHGIKNIICVDICNEFIKECKKKGFECFHTPIEEWSPVRVDGVHASHVLEHCYDIKKAIDVIKKTDASWVYISVPIEPDGSKDPAHLSPIKNKRFIIDMFPGWKRVETRDKPGCFSILFYKEERCA